MSEEIKQEEPKQQEPEKQNDSWKKFVDGFNKFSDNSERYLKMPFRWATDHQYTMFDFIGIMMLLQCFAQNLIVAGIIIYFGVQVIERMIRKHLGFITTKEKYIETRAMLQGILVAILKIPEEKLADVGLNTEVVKSFRSALEEYDKS